MKEGFANSRQAAQMLQFRCPRWEQLPAIGLYMDQVTGYLNEVFAPLCVPGEEKLLTKAMVNNYVKQKVLPPPESKKYSRTHVAELLAICVLKQVLSIQEVGRLIRLQAAGYETREVYDYFCEQLEAALAQAATGQPEAYTGSEAQQVVFYATRAFACKIALQKQLLFQLEEPEQE